MTHSYLFWIIFHAVIIFFLIVDLKISENWKTKRKSLYLTLLWITLALTFNLWIFEYYGKEPALQFLYRLRLRKVFECRQSICFLLIFTAFKIPDRYQHKILFWGFSCNYFPRSLYFKRGGADCSFSLDSLYFRCFSALYRHPFYAAEEEGAGS